MSTSETIISISIGILIGIIILVVFSIAPVLDKTQERLTSLEEIVNQNKSVSETIPFKKCDEYTVQETIVEGYVFKYYTCTTPAEEVYYNRTRK